MSIYNLTVCKGNLVLTSTSSCAVDIDDNSVLIKIAYPKFIFIYRLDGCNNQIEICQNISSKITSAISSVHLQKVKVTFPQAAGDYFYLLSAIYLLLLNIKACQGRIDLSVDPFTIEMLNLAITFTWSNPLFNQMSVLIHEYRNLYGTFFPMATETDICIIAGWRADEVINARFHALEKKILECTKDEIKELRVKIGNLERKYEDMERQNVALIKIINDLIKCCKCHNESC